MIPVEITNSDRSLVTDSDTAGSKETDKNRGKYGWLKFLNWNSGFFI